MDDEFRTTCIELIDEPEKLTEYIRIYLDIPNKCKLCSYGIENKKKYCNFICENIDNIYIKGTLSELQTFLTKEENIILQEKYSSSLVHNYYQYKEKISDEKLIYLIKHENKSISGKWILNLGRSERWNSMLVEHTNIEDIQYFCSPLIWWGSNEKLLELLINKYTIEELHRQKKTIYLSIFNTLHPILKPHITFEDIESFKEFRQPLFIRHMYETLGKDVCISRNIYKYCNKIEDFSLFYESIDDEKAYYFLNNHLNIPEYLRSYKIKDMNALIYRFTEPVISALMENWYDNTKNSYMNSFLYSQIIKLKPGDITIQTFNYFYLVFFVKRFEFLEALHNMMRTFDIREIDFNMIGRDIEGKEYTLMHLILTNCGASNPYSNFDMVSYIIQNRELDIKKEYLKNYFWKLLSSDIKLNTDYLRLGKWFQTNRNELFLSGYEYFLSLTSSEVLKNKYRNYFQKHFT